MILAVFLLIAAFFAVYILMPFFEETFRKKRLDFGEAEVEELRQKKEQVLEALRDLEYDYKMQKMTELDYKNLKEKLTQQAVEIMKTLDSLEKGSKANAIGQQTGTRT
jgi:hypothetical protein